MAEYGAIFGVAGTDLGLLGAVRVKIVSHRLRTAGQGVWVVRFLRKKEIPVEIYTRPNL
jgi:hypothetical protein